MPRPKGALNKRTRAALSAAAAGKLGKDADRALQKLIDIFNDPNKDEAARMRAIDIALQYLKPKLAAIEQTTIDERDQKDPAELATRLGAIFAEKPELLRQIFGLAITPDLLERIVMDAVAKAPEIRERLLAALQPHALH